MFNKKPRIRLQDSAFVDAALTTLMLHFIVQCAMNRAARFGVTPQTIDRARKAEMAKAPARAEAAVEQRFAAYPRFFESLGMLDSLPGNWTGSGRIHQKYAGDEDAIEGALDHGDNYIVTENPQSIPNPLLLALDIEAVTPRQMFYEALRDIPTIIGAAMIKHYRRTGYSPEFYEAFLKTSGVEFLIPLFRSMLASS